MDTNFVICRNEVIVEGVNVGQFESFEFRGDSRTLGKTAVLTLPLYSIGNNSAGVAKARTRAVFVTDTTERKINLIRPCAQVEVWCWYDSWDAKESKNKSHEKVRVFTGFVEHIGEGYPAKVFLQDNTFCLRFGAFENVVTENMTLKNIIERAIPIAQKAFDDERDRSGFTRSLPRLTYSTEKKNVQAVTSPLDLRNISGGRPYDIVRHLMSQLCLYGGVSEEFNVFVGAGVEKSDRPVIHLNTRDNVISRNLVPVDSRFVDYDVQVYGILENGRRFTASGGVATSRDRDNKSEFERTYGVSYKCFSSLRNADELKRFADRQLRSLQGVRNKGNIECLLYPSIQLMDWVAYTDTVFPELSGGYYVVDYSFKANDKGYFQTLGVTDKVFAL